MVDVQEVEIKGKLYKYVRVEMDAAPLVLLKGSGGYVMCGYLNLEAAEKLGDAAVRVTGVKDLDTVLQSKAAGVTSRATALGIQQGQKVVDFIHLL